MLLPDPHALWLISMLVVVFTRDYKAPVLPLVVIFQVVVWMTSSANQDPVLAMFDFDARRVSYITYGLVAGQALVWAMNTRDLIPVHGTAKKRVHVAGPLSILAVSYGTYALATATGLTKTHEEFGDWTTTELRGWEIAIFVTLFVVLTLLFAASLYLSWRGTDSVLTFRYRDGGLRVNNHPPSRIIVELILALTLVVAPHLFWIYLTHPPVGLPQWIGGLIALLLELVGWVLISYVFERRHNMSTTYFARSEAHITWDGFVFIVGGTHLLSNLLYLIAALIFSTPAAIEVTLIVITAITVVIAGVVWLYPARMASGTEGGALVGPDVQEKSRFVSNSDSDALAMRQQRLRDLGL
jgi:hypothetical protein